MTGTTPALFRAARFGGLFLFPLFLLILASAAQIASGQTRLKIFVTNDVHGYVQENPAAKQLGLPKLKGCIEAARAKGFDTFLLDSGDAYSGSAFAQFDQGRTVARLMRLAGYRAMVPGNHIFDFNAETRNPLYPSEVLIPASTGGNPEAFTAAAVNISYAGGLLPGVRQQPLVIYDETASDPDGLRVIVAGILNPDTVGDVNGKLLGDYDFGRKGSDAETRTYVMELLGKALQPYSRPNDVVIVLSHCGYWKEVQKAGKLTGKDLALVEHADIVVDGHSHRAIQPERIAQAWYVNGGRYLEHFTEIVIEREGGKPAAPTVELRNYEDAAACAPDRALGKAVDAVYRAQRFDRVLFTLEAEKQADFTTRNIRNGDSPLGRVITGLMRLAAGADLAFYSSGPFRANLFPGPVTVKHIHDVVPFGGQLVSVSLTGEQITKLLAARLTPGRDGFPQLSGLAVFAYPSGDKSGARLDIAAVLDGQGKRLEPQRHYRVAMSSATLRSAAKQGGFSASSASIAGPMADTIVSYLERHPGVTWGQFAGAPGLRLFPDRAEAEKALESAARGR